MHSGDETEEVSIVFRNQSLTYTTSNEGSARSRLSFARDLCYPWWEVSLAAPKNL